MKKQKVKKIEVIVNVELQSGKKKAVMTLNNDRTTGHSTLSFTAGSTIEHLNFAAGCLAAALGDVNDAIKSREGKPVNGTVEEIDLTRQMH